MTVEIRPIIKMGDSYQIFDTLEEAYQEIINKFR